MRKYNLITGIIWLVLAILIFFESLNLGLGTLYFPGPGFLPVLTSIFLGIFSILLILESMIKKGKKEESVVIWVPEIRWKKILFSLSFLIIYALSLEKLGYLLSTFLFMLFLFKFIEPQKWSVAVFGSIVAVLLSYIVFGVLLQSQLPVGVIGKIFHL